MDMGVVVYRAWAWAAGCELSVRIDFGRELKCHVIFCNILVCDREEWKEGVGSDKVLEFRVRVRVMIDSSGGDKYSMG
jgi:hypothetical protein